MEVTAEKMEAQEEIVTNEVKAAPEPQERYFVVMVAPMRDKMDIPNPVITVGNKAIKGPRIQIKRQSWIPMTGSYVQTLEHAKYTIWRPVEGEDRKVPEYRTRFPLEDKIEITKEGFVALREKLLKEKVDLKETDISQYRV